MLNRIAWTATMLVIFASLVGVLVLGSGCEPQSGPPDAKTAEDGKVANGRITNDPKSKGSIQVYRKWAGGNEPAGDPRTLRPGGETNMTQDYDGFCTRRRADVTIYWGPLTLSAKVKAGDCLKVRDGQHAVVRVR